MRNGNGKKGGNIDSANNLFIPRSPSGANTIKPRQDFQPPQDWNHDTKISNPKQRPTLEEYYQGEERRQPSIPTNSRPSSANTIRSKSVSRKPSSGMPQPSYDQLLEKAANLATINFGLKFENDSLRSQIDELAQQGERTKKIEKPIDLTSAYSKLGKKFDHLSVEHSELSDKYQRLHVVYEKQRQKIDKQRTTIREKDQIILSQDSELQKRDQTISRLVSVIEDLEQKPQSGNVLEEDSFSCDDSQQDYTHPDEISRPIAKKEGVPVYSPFFQKRDTTHVDFFDHSTELRKPEPPKSITPTKEGRPSRPLNYVKSGVGRGGNRSDNNSPESS